MYLSLHKVPRYSDIDDNLSLGLRSSENGEDATTTPKKDTYIGWIWYSIEDACSAVLLAVVKKSNYLVDTLPSSILEAVWACWHRHLRALLFFFLFFSVCFM